MSSLHRRERVFTWQITFRSEIFVVFDGDYGRVASAVNQATLAVNQATLPVNQATLPVNQATFRSIRRLSGQSGDLPVNQATSGESGDPPGESGDLSGESGDLPGESGDLPSESGDLSGESGDLPGEYFVELMAYACGPQLPL
jgi:hypothetical protein